MRKEGSIIFDIVFYQKVFDFKYKLMGFPNFDSKYVYLQLEKFRSKEPVVYNIETTNRCNMCCVMCPRTTMMTRPIEDMDMATFIKIVDQIRPWTKQEWDSWIKFVTTQYRKKPIGMSENHFFLYVIPKVIVLHGYGDPLLDRVMSERIGILTEKGIPSYFSCNPSNIDIEKTEEMFKAGLGYIKYSIEATTDELHKAIRGNASNFTDSYKKILQLLEIKRQKDYKTVLVITMLDLNRSWQKEQWDSLRELFKGEDVYIYLKSQDQQWYENKNEGTKSYHWLEPCQFPWSSMTIKSNGEAVQCVEDFNNEIVLGDAKTESLFDIWNGDKYRKLRQDHFALTKGIKCTKQCDMSLWGNYCR